MDYVELVGSMYRKRIADGVHPNQAKSFNHTDFPGTPYGDVRNALIDVGFIEGDYIRNFSLSGRAIDYFMSE